ncbi:HalOD1 output domain-containing protein [Halalkalirubrum salinum]|uniref:HalOD1 output domain-containing protein n=1 Tax=Halalkalirubrum salinum TaxID=2563889 RepID=UPI0010FBAC1D|nr:HalOD1 output domain-containing protein [Halalkalirubrum salinum]
MTKDPSNTGPVDYVLNIYHHQHDWSASEPLSHSVVQAIAECNRTTPERGPPLSEAINTDSLDQLFTIYQSEEYRTDHVVFTHQGCTVVVYRDGHILVSPIDHHHSRITDR